MRILSLDYDPIFGNDATRSTFSSDTSVFDYDVVIWDPAVSFENYNPYSDTYQGLPCLTDFESSRIKSDTKRRKAEFKEFKEFIEAGRTLVVIGRPPQSCYVATGQMTYSGTGRNARGTRIVGAFDILSAIPVADASFDKARGDRIEIVGDSAIAKLIKKYLPHIQYTATMGTPPGSVVAKVTGTTRTVGAFLKVKSGGSLIILPSPIFKTKYDEKTEEETYPDEAAEYQLDLLAAIEASSGTSEIARPSWASDYATEDQQKLRDATAKQREVVEKARTKLTGLQADVEVAALRDQLFLGTGRQLELRVRDVLEQLGATVTEPEPGRDDWRAEFDGSSVVVEVKGVSKSAAEKHAAQLEKWVAGAFEEIGKMPKGILIVNTWRETPLADRSKEDFPEQMIPYCTGRQHCLLTGLDLFVIASEVDADPSRAKFWSDKILNTSGRLEGVPDWRTYIHQASAKTAIVPRPE